MSNHRYSFSFIISSLIFLLIAFAFSLLPQKVEKPKTLRPKAINIAIITPLVQKIIKKERLPKEITITPPIPIPPKVIKKIKPKSKPKKKIKKRVIKKPLLKESKPKKKIKKRIVKKRIKKKIVKKKIVKKRVITKKIVKKKRIIKKHIKKHLVKKRITAPKKVEKHPIKKELPIAQEFLYQEIPQPKKVQPVIKPSLKPHPPVKVDKSVNRRAFLSQVRKKIINNKKYPRMALRRHIQGSVKVKFDITSNGNLSNIQFINGKTILQKSVRKAIEKSFPISIPNSLRSELPIHDIYITIHFNID